jgi:hypothetical protein
MATTTNYGWETADDTDLVKDGALAMRTLGSAIDTTTKALNPSTTLGDVEYRSSTANTNTRLAIGTSGQVLTVAAGVPSWATPAAAGGATLLATLSLSGSTTSTSTLAAASYTSYQIIIKNAYVNSNGNMWIRLNGDSGSNYYRATLGSDTTTAFAQNEITSLFTIAAIPALSPVYNGVSGIINLPRINDTDFQFIQSTMYSNFNSSSLRNNLSSGVYDGSAAITTITFGTTQSFSGGTAYVYGVN